MTEPRPDPAGPAVARFAPRRDLAFGTGIAGIVAAAAGVLTDDRACRLLLVLAALILLALSAADLIWVPRLTVTALGLRVNSPSARVDLAWTQLETVRVEERARLGRIVRTLEIDAGEQLVVLGRHSLGVDPVDASDLIRAFDPR